MDWQENEPNCWNSNYIREAHSEQLYNNYMDEKNQEQYKPYKFVQMFRLVVKYYIFTRLVNIQQE